MARAIDPRRTRKALKALKALHDSAAAGNSGVFSSWEEDFIAGVSARLETHGSAFADYRKGAPDEALSRLQHQTLKELRKKQRKALLAPPEEPQPDRQGLKRKPKKTPFQPR
jgi:hypothetical protein